MIETLQRWAEERGYRVAWGSAESLEQARAALATHHERGEIDAAVWTDELAPLAAASEQPAGSIVVVAVPAPAAQVAFEAADGRVEALLPPTYFRYRATFETVRQDLAAHGLPGARVDHLGGPIKGTAARLGLVRYGRNNVTYAGALGSFVQLCGFATDVTLPGGVRPTEPRLLDECLDCQMCEALCPTGAIDGERVLLHAERCLALVNESTGDWPDWVPDAAHTCLIGCLACQRACPANPELPVLATGLTFSRVETAGLLDGNRQDGRRELGVTLKMAWLGQPDIEPVLARNLRALVRQNRLRATRSRGACAAASR